MNALTVAVAYHAARDLLPHNPIRKTAYQPSGAVYFQPELRRYPSPRLAPQLAPEAADQDPFAEFTSTARAAGVESGAWVVLLHNSRLATSNPEVACVTAFGDPLLHVLCPSQSAVRAYCVALCSDIARYRPDWFHLESLNFMPYDHGGHHERTMIDLSPSTRFLLGVCFCPACVAVAEATGVDARGVLGWVRATLEHAFEVAGPLGEHDTSDLEWVLSQLDGQVGAYVAVRQNTVTSLIAEVAAAIHLESPASQVSLLDVSGALTPAWPGLRSLDLGWRDGLDLRRCVGGPVDRLSICGYFSTQDRLLSEVRAYVDFLPPKTPLEVILRPAWPDCADPAELAARVAALREIGPIDLGFYCYGLTRLESLDAIRTALNQAPQDA